jgi:hypothetical protein
MTFNIITLIPLSQSGTQISIVELNENNNLRYLLKWGKRHFEINRDQIEQMMSAFFTPQVTKKLGASMDTPPIDGFGYYLNQNYPGLLPRDASAIAPLLVHLGRITWHRQGKPIYLTRS